MKYRTNFKTDEQFFHMQFRDFNVALDQLKRHRKRIQLYFCHVPDYEPEASETYDKQDKAITDMVREMGGMQTRYMSTANRILLRIRRSRRCSSRIISILWII